MGTEDSQQPPWVSWIRGDIKAVNERIDKLVTTESFRQEQSRVNDKFDAMGREIGDLKKDLAQESQARQTETQLRLREEAQNKDKLLTTQRQTQWQWFLIVAGPLVTWFLANFLRTGA